MSKTRTITMSGAPPVKIIESDWPVIAHGWAKNHDGEVACQANETWDANIRVRRHADGRHIVYGRYDYDTNWLNRRDVRRNAGILLDDAGGLIEAIQSVGAELAESADGALDIEAVVRECIADLPAVTL